MKTIQGKVVYKDIGTGFYGIVDRDGKEWRPVNLPEQLKKEGRNVKVKIKEVEEGFSVFMWGTPVEVVSFYT